MKKTDRPCELCGHDDDHTAVVASTLGPFSQNICSVCAAMNAEDISITKEVGANNAYYDIITDTYRNPYTYELIPIKLKDGREFKTRNELIKYYYE